MVSDKNLSYHIYLIQNWSKANIIKDKCICITSYTLQKISNKLIFFLGC